MEKNFLDSIKNRRSYYALSKETTISDDKLKEILETTLLHTPSAFNSQTTRIVLLLGEQNDRLWDITMDELRKVVPADQFANTEAKINNFKNTYGTVLFFEDMEIVHNLENQFALYASNFKPWSLQTSAMHQLVVWTALEAEGLGASLQHYSELISDSVMREWDLPASWRLDSQMPFGKPIAKPGEKEYQPIDSRLKILK